METLIKSITWKSSYSYLDSKGFQEKPIKVSSDGKNYP